MGYLIFEEELQWDFLLEEERTIWAIKNEHCTTQFHACVRFRNWAFGLNCKDEDNYCKYRKGTSKCDWRNVLACITHLANLSPKMAENKLSELALAFCCRIVIVWKNWGIHTHYVHSPLNVCVHKYIEMRHKHSPRSSSPLNTVSPQFDCY